MPIVHIEKDILDLIIDCLIECGHEEKILDIIDITNDSDCCESDENVYFEETEDDIQITTISKVEEKAKDKQLKRGRVADY